MVVLVMAAGGAGVLVAGSQELPRLPSESSFTSARRLLEEGRISEAKSIYAQQLSRDPRSIEAIRGLALCARDEGDDETALGHFQELTKLAPKDLVAWRQQALAASRLGRNFEALSAAQAALSLASNGDRVMSDLMTRIMTSDSGFRSPYASEAGGAGVRGFDPLQAGSGRSTFDHLSELHRPEPPDPLKGLPLPGKGK
jgi:tetratricopeptide (TPR) repeat protein